MMVHAQVLTGDARELLKTLPDESVQCCITSPPYFGLRDYQVDGQVGLEPTPQDFVASLVEVFREVRRVLHKDGTLWLNLGDSFANDGKWGGSTGGKHVASLHGEPIGRLRRSTGLKPKDLIGIPWRVAFALQEDGWWLRSDIVWEKPNCMPESVTDRPTRSHEYIFLLTKSDKYYYDCEAIKEEASPASIARVQQDNFENQTGGPKDYGVTGINASRSMRKTLENFARNPRRNKRDVWTIPTKPYKGAHFATFPPALIEPCILAGTSEKGCCAACGKPWKRVIERTGHVNAREEAHVPGNVLTKTDSTGWAPLTRATDDWEASCSCDVDTVPCTVLDPFAGSGTTLSVAVKHGRDSIGIELNPDYVKLIEQRLARTQPLLFDGLIA